LDWLRSESLLTTEPEEPSDGRVLQFPSEVPMHPPGLEPFIGRWKITDMELWEEETINEFEPAQLEIKPDGLGSISGSSPSRETSTAARLSATDTLRSSGPGSAGTTATTRRAEAGASSARIAPSTA
jgi:hypothetical protein